MDVLREGMGVFRDGMDVLRHGMDVLRHPLVVRRHLLGFLRRSLVVRNGSGSYNALISMSWNSTGWLSDCREMNLSEIACFLDDRLPLIGAGP